MNTITLDEYLETPHGYMGAIQVGYEDGFVMVDEDQLHFAYIGECWSDGELIGINTPETLPGRLEEVIDILGLTRPDEDIDCPRCGGEGGWMRQAGYKQHTFPGAGPGDVTRKEKAVECDLCYGQGSGRAGELAT